ncbi:MAG: hypothetical protein N3E37_00215 [Candidatus Micrarchaeota archaeon]|nr:hypothetical protein [Candidatus Micrarchaeota archaeon]
MEYKNNNSLLAQRPNKIIGTPQQDFISRRYLLSGYSLLVSTLQELRERRIIFFESQEKEKAKIHGFERETYTVKTTEEISLICISGRTHEEEKSSEFELRIVPLVLNINDRNLLLGEFLVKKKNKTYPILFYRSSGNTRGYDSGKWRISALSLTIPISALVDNPKKRSEKDYISLLKAFANSDSLNSLDLDSFNRLFYQIYERYIPVIARYNNSRYLALTSKEEPRVTYLITKPESIDLRYFWLIKLKLDDKLTEDVKSEVKRRHPEFTKSEDFDKMILIDADVFLRLDDFLESVYTHLLSKGKLARLDERNADVKIGNETLVEYLWKRQLLYVCPYLPYSNVRDLEELPTYSHVFRTYPAFSIFGAYGYIW